MMTKSMFKTRYIYIFLLLNLNDFNRNFEYLEFLWLFWIYKNFNSTFYCSYKLTKSWRLILLGFSVVFVVVVYFLAKQINLRAVYPYNKLTFVIGKFWVKILLYQQWDLWAHLIIYILHNIKQNLLFISFET